MPFSMYVCVYTGCIYILCRISNYRHLQGYVNPDLYELDLMYTVPKTTYKQTEGA